MERVLELDTNVFWWINSHHCGVLDWIMWVLSQGWSWVIVLVAVIIFVTLKYEPKKWWVVLVGLILCILIGDRISVMCFKDVFCRPRPCHALEGVTMFRTNCGGQYGFVSSHAANVFTFAVFLAMRYRKMPRKTKFYWLGFGLLSWATLVCYSRPYLGKHYPGDVICGALLGVALGFLIWWLIGLVDKFLEKREKIKIS